MSKLHIAKVQIFNTLGIKELEFESGRFTEITAKNGKGKTSVLEAIKSVFEGGNDATLVHAGEEKSEIVLVLNDRTVIRKRTSLNSTAVTVERDGQRQAKPQETINALRDMISVNPVDFLRAPAKKRATILLETMPLEIDLERVRTIIGDPAYELVGEFGLEQLEAAYKSVFDDRRLTNRSATEKVAGINSLAETLPKAGAGVEGVHPDDTEEGLQARISALDETWRAEQERIATKLDGMRAEKDAAVEGFRNEIAALQAKVTATVEEFAEWERKAGLHRQTKEQAYNADVAGPQRALDLIRADREGAARHAATRATMTKMREDADALERDSERMSKALKALEAYKLELLATLPVPGLTVEDGVLMRDGVSFDRLNKQQQVEIAVAIAKLRAGDLGVVCIDEFEALDTEHREALIEQAEASGLQFFVTRVSDDDALTVTSH